MQPQSLTACVLCLFDQHSGMSNSLADAADQQFFFRCGVCNRHGRYSKTTLILEFGPSAPVAELPARVARWRACAHLGVRSDTPCGIGFDLAAMVMTDKREREALKWRRG